MTNQELQTQAQFNALLQQLQNANIIISQQAGQLAVQEQELKTLRSAVVTGPKEETK